jgi:hypothetical protein
VRHAGRVIALLLALVLAPLPRTGVAVQTAHAVDLYRLDGRQARTLPGWKLGYSVAAPPGVVLLRDPQRRLWRLDRAGLARTAALRLPPDLPRGQVFWDDRGRVVSSATASRTVAVDVRIDGRVAVHAGCFLAARRASYRLEICGYTVAPNEDSAIVRVDARGRRIVAGPAYPKIYGRPDGSWRSASVGPGGRILAQWSGECEAPLAFVVAGGRTTAAATDTAGHAAESYALGWWGGKPLLSRPVPLCSAGAPRPGVYLGAQRLVPLAFLERAERWG